MLDLAIHSETRVDAPARAPQPVRPLSASAYLAAVLDELDYGVVLLIDGAHVAHLNHAARCALDDAHPLQRIGGELRARATRDAAPLQEAIAAAAARGLRRLLPLGLDRRCSVSVVPIAAGDDGRRAVLVVLEKHAVCEPLSVEGFARCHALTDAETRVLVGLCSGLSPREVSQTASVAVSTVRSQIGSIRAKTGAVSIRALVQQVAVLPPIKHSLRQGLV